MYIYIYMQNGIHVVIYIYIDIHTYLKMEAWISSIMVNDMKKEYGI